MDAFDGYQVRCAEPDHSAERDGGPESYGDLAMQRLRLRWLAWGLAGLFLASVPARGASLVPIAKSGHPGGLVVFLGEPSQAELASLARTGRYVVQVLLSADRVEPLRRELADAGTYGAVSVRAWQPGQPLPYTENLVNVVVVAKSAAGTASELGRVVQPLGGVFVAGNHGLGDALTKAGFSHDDTVASGGSWKFYRKPWPAEMDEWSHPRHGADGNAVSNDQIVGPPRRVRWVAGPWQEVANLVTQEGINYYGGLWTRNCFNGPRLLDRRLEPST